MTAPKSKAQKIAEIAGTAEATPNGPVLPTAPDGETPAFPPPADDAAKVEAEAKAKAEEEAAKATAAAEQAAKEAEAAKAAEAAYLATAVDFGGEVLAVVTFGRYRATINGREVVAERGRLVKGSKAFIARGVALGGLKVE